MVRFPPQLLQAIFYQLDFKELVRAQPVCRQWQQIILDSFVWPSFVGVLSRDFDTWAIKWPDWAHKKNDILFRLDPDTTCQVLWLLSKESTKSLSLININAAPEDMFDVLPNFVSLEKIYFDIASISSRELISILESLLQITTFVLRIDKVRGMPMGLLKTTQY
jgi:hypothetical protein